MKLKKCLTVALGLTMLTSSIAVQAAAIEPKGEDLVIQTDETRDMEEDMDMDMGGDYGDVTVTQVPEYTGGDFTFFVDTKNLPKDATVDFPEITLTNSDGSPFPGNFIVGNEFTSVNSNSGAITFKAGAFEQMNQAIESAGLENPTMTITGNLASQETGAFLFFELSTTVRTSESSVEKPEIPTPPDVTPENPDVTPEVPETEQPPVTPENPETEQPPITPENPETKPEVPEKISVTIDEKTETWTGTGDITLKVNLNGATTPMFKGVDGSMNGMFFATNATFNAETNTITIPEKSIKDGIENVKKNGGKVSDIKVINLSITFASEDFKDGFSTVDTTVSVSNLMDTEPETITPEAPNTDNNKPIQGQQVDFTENPKVEVKPVHEIPKTGDVSQVATFATTGISSLGLGILALLKRRK